MNKKLIGIIEISKGSKHKYEHKDGNLLLDRTIDIPYPCNYGYIPDTLCDDGDPIDVFVISEQPILNLSQVKLEILGYIKMIDNGEGDPKLIAKIAGDKPKVCIDYEIAEIIYFLERYKKGVKIRGQFGKKEAFKQLEKSITLFNKSKMTQLVKNNKS
jgi:inorganic pyrophosphatase